MKNMAMKMAGLLMLTIFMGLTVEAVPDDPGYFLSWKQKKELMALGRIQDAAGTWYDVWICPGYKPPAVYARDSFKRAGSNFHEYLEANKYRSIKSNSSACFNWALHDCGLGFTLKGIPRAWSTSFSAANKRTQRRVFGWWLAYPWAIFESSVESAFRGVVGTVGTVGGVASGLVIVPGYHALDSAVAGVWNLGVNTIILPTVGITWNTVVSPPLALIGQKPAVSRVDGFWVTVVESGRLPEARQLTPEEVKLLSEWGLLLVKETQPYAAKREKSERDAALKQEQLYRDMTVAREEAHRQRAALVEEERAHIQHVIATNGMAASFAASELTQVSDPECEREIRRYLTLQNIPNVEINRLLELLRTYHVPAVVVPVNVRKKTDPLQRSAEIVEQAAEDTFK